MSTFGRRLGSSAGPAVYHWNPRPVLLDGRLGPYARSLRRTNNFGDMLGPMIVERLLARHGIAAAPRLSHDPDVRGQRVLGVGSIVHRARTGDVIWGAGVNGNAVPDAYRFTGLDVRAVRGALTRDFLRDRGIAVPDVLGDPAVLVPHLFPEWRPASDAVRYPLTVVPNLFDLGAARYLDPSVVVDPRAPVAEVVTRIAASDFVTGSSLHGIIIAEAFGVPAVPMSSGHEHRFKYDDYYTGTGREEAPVVETLSQAERQCPGAPAVPDIDGLLDAFPIDLWRADESLGG